MMPRPLTARFLTLSLATALPGPLAAQPARARPPVEVHEATIAELQSAMTSGRVSSVQLVDAYLARMAAYDRQGPALNAMIRVSPNARADARRMDEERRQGRVRGPLHGIPIILKDNFDTADMPTSGGSLALADHQTPDDAFVVRKLRDAGAVILGKANMHELAAGITTIGSLAGQTRNPYDPRRCPGGSSGGTGAAIAASFAAVGWGSDTCGSIRIPSAFGSLAGLRPTQGLVSRTGIQPLSHTQDIAGPLARTIGDLAIALDVSVGVDPSDSVTGVLAARPAPRFTDSLSKDALRGARIGILMNYFTEADGEILDTVRSAIRAMTAAGADTVRVNVADFDSLLANTSVINFEHKHDMIDYLARTPGARVKSIADILATGLESGVLEARFRLADSVGTRDSERYRRALARQVAARERIIAIMDSLRVDALVYPTMRRKPVLIGDAQLGSTCGLSAQTGLPALSIPAGFTAEGLPVGVELVGRPFSDIRLVSMGYAFEQLGPRRRAPFTTPPLVNGKAPGPVTFSAVARTSSAAAGAARGAFTYDRITGALRYDVRVTGVQPSRVQAVVLRRRDSAGRLRVVHTMLGPVATSGAGATTLSAIDRDALANGLLVLSLVVAGHQAADAQLVLMRR
ncbi:MAG: gatAX [Geminicoccaceae bacterium]|jgi:Asp-tRNA(Asn)/Glu-tRNA(Gln) amidotransferase A subunit family amidase|nr:gatAX [Geminicoccaceae bacterium]